MGIVKSAGVDLYPKRSNFWKSGTKLFLITQKQLIGGRENGSNTISTKLAKRATNGVFLSPHVSLNRGIIK